jgi:hypothetical protein
MLAAMVSRRKGSQEFCLPWPCTPYSPSPGSNFPGVTPGSKGRSGLCCHQLRRRYPLKSCCCCCLAHTATVPVPQSRDSGLERTGVEMMANTFHKLQTHSFKIANPLDFFLRENPSMFV